MGRVAVLLLTLVTLLGCSGMFRAMHLPGLGEVAIQAGEPFELEVVSTGVPTRLVLITSISYRAAKGPSVLVELTARAPGMKTIRLQEDLPREQDGWYVEDAEELTAVGSITASTRLVKLPRVAKGKVIHVSGTVDAGPRNKLSGATLVLKEQ